MIELKTVIDKNGYIVDMCVEIEDGRINNFILGEGQQTVTKYSSALGYVRPKWNGLEWIEGATEEEMQEFKEVNKIIQEPSEQEKIISNIMLENAELKQQIAEISLQLAELKGDK